VPGLAIYNNRAEKDFASIADHVYSGAFTSGGYPIREIIELKRSSFLSKKRRVHFCVLYSRRIE